MNEASVERIADLVVAARHVVVLTGAGISTPSGIPDFRSPATGLWQRSDPEVVASLAGFRRNPQAFCSWLRPLVESVVQAQPNPAHVSLAALQRAGLVRTIITQNIDGLHQRAGARRVLELHGHLRRATCLQCRHRFPASGLLQAMLATAAVPRCPRCGGLAKPDVILFGEMLPARALARAERETLASDLVWVIGSSLTVVPASLLPWRALDNGARLIVVNRTPTPLDHRAEVLLRDDVVQAVPAVAAACLARSSSDSPPGCRAPN